MRGDATLFTRRDEVESEWKIITPIEEAWAQLPAPQFPNYAAGSDGPELATQLLTANGHRWMPISKQNPADMQEASEKQGTADAA
jgi:glucose-6-phosphate 1-dehydrogenase